MKTHGIAELTFEKLDFAGQSRSINGTVSHLEKAINAHVRRATEEGRDTDEILRSRVEEVRRMLRRLERTRGTRNDHDA